MLTDEQIAEVLAQSEKNAYYANTGNDYRSNRLITEMAREIQEHRRAKDAHSGDAERAWLDDWEPIVEKTMQRAQALGVALEPDEERRLLHSHRLIARVSYLTGWERGHSQRSEVIAGSATIPAEGC